MVRRLKAVGQSIREASVLHSATPSSLFLDSLLRQRWHGSVPGLLLRQERLHQILHLVLTHNVFRIVVDVQFKNYAEGRASVLQLFLQADGNTLSVHRVGLRQNHAEKFRSEAKNGI